MKCAACNEPCLECLLICGQAHYGGLSLVEKVFLIKLGPAHFIGKLKGTCQPFKDCMCACAYCCCFLHRFWGQCVDKYRPQQLHAVISAVNKVFRA